MLIYGGIVPGMPVFHKPIVDTMFRHESGIHVNAMLKKYETYEPFPRKQLAET